MLCICLPFAAGECFAQRYLPGQKGIQLMLGGVDDFGSNVKHLRGNFQLGVALSRYNRNHSRWLFGADYVKKHYSYKDIAIPKAQFTGEVGYFVPFFSDRGRNVFFSAGLSALAGYETTNWNCKLLYDGAMTDASFMVLPRLSRWRRSFPTGWFFFSMSARGYSSDHPWGISTRR